MIIIVFNKLQTKERLGTTNTQPIPRIWSGGQRLVLECNVIIAKGLDYFLTFRPLPSGPLHSGLFASFNLFRWSTTYERTSIYKR